MSRLTKTIDREKLSPNDSEKIVPELISDKSDEDELRGVSSTKVEVIAPGEFHCEEIDKGCSLYFSLLCIRTLVNSIIEFHSDLWQWYDDISILFRNVEQVS